MTRVDPTALALCIIFPFLSIVAVIARFRARCVLKLRLGADDWVVIPALVNFSLGNAANILFGPIKANLGQYMPLDEEGFAISGEQLVALEKMAYITPVLAAIGLGCARWSVLLLYNRIFETRIFRRAVYIMSALNLGWMIAFVFAFIFECTPVDQVWKSQHGKRKHCIGIDSNYAYAVSSVILDILTLSMPWPMIWRLHMELKKKIAVTGIFLLGGIVTAAGIGKTYAFYTVGGKIAKSHDFTYEEAPLFYWTVPECSLAVVCACLPVLTPIYYGFTNSSFMESVRNLLTLRTLRSSTTNASRNVPFTYVSGRINDQSQENYSAVRISKTVTEPGSVKSAGTEVEMRDLEAGNVNEGPTQKF